MDRAIISDITVKIFKAIVNIDQNMTITGKMIPNIANFHTEDGKCLKVVEFAIQMDYVDGVVNTREIFSDYSFKLASGKNQWSPPYDDDIIMAFYSKKSHWVISQKGIYIIPHVYDLPTDTFIEKIVDQWEPSQEGHDAIIGLLKESCGVEFVTFDDTIWIPI